MFRKDATNNKKAIKLVIRCVRAWLRSFLHLILSALVRHEVLHCTALHYISLLLTGTAMGSVSDVARKEHVGPIGAAIGFRKSVRGPGVSSYEDCILQLAGPGGMDIHVVHTLPPEDHRVSYNGRKVLLAFVG